MKKLLLLVGLVVMVSGSVFAGCIKGNCENGFGTYNWSIGDKYVGEWKIGKRYGKGKLTWSDGVTYEGEWKNNKMHGKGTYIWKNGDKYVGEVKGHPTSGIDGISHHLFKINCHGLGTFTWANGDQYIGEWKDRKKHGKGTKTYTDGRVEKGIWKNDLFTGKKKDHNESKIKKHTKSDKQALTIEDELLKIKELYEKDLITEEVYKARQISIMESYKH